MAWRDSRSSRGRLLLFVSSIVLGVAALVAIGSFRENADLAIEREAKNLLGADLALRGRRAFDAESESLFARLGEERSRQTHLASMAYFPEKEDFRLVALRAVEPGYPYYGTLKTEPASAAVTFFEGPQALVDDGLMQQFDVEVGDQVRFGEETFTVAGRLLEVPGEAMAWSEALPRVYIPLESLDATQLVQPGSRVSYHIFFRFDPQADMGAVVEGIEPDLERLQLRPDTVERRKRSLGRIMANLSRFLGLVGFIALLLGSVGIAAAIHSHVRQKLGTVAILSCLGSSSRQTFSIYLIQAAAMGLIGVAAGCLLGLLVQFYLPILLADFLSFDLPFEFAWSAILTAAVIGLCLTLLFALLPLLPLRRISPLRALRSGYEEIRGRTDPWLWAAGGAISLAILGFAMAQTTRWETGLGFFAGLVVTFLLLAATARLLMWGVRRLFPARWPYEWRQGMANLFRPQNQTALLILSLGLGTFLIATLQVVQASLLSQAALLDRDERPNLVFFDVQPDQVQPAIELLRNRRAPILQNVPIVTMRLARIKGRTVDELLEEDRERRRWAYTREYRSTYRDHLMDSETVVAGTWQGRAELGNGPVPISLEVEIAQDLDVGLGDELVFDVQGIELGTRVGSLRRVDWDRFQPNFFAVFPVGALEAAPSFSVIVTRVESTERLVELQRSIVRRFPNVSTIDLSQILKTVDSLLDRVAAVVRFMALFSILTGLVVLGGAVTTSRYQKIKEAVLLRTLGASRGQIVKILLIEYLLLGSLATLAGLGLSLAASWALTALVFKTDFRAPLAALALLAAGTVSLVVAIGVANTRGVWSRPPLEVLRSEAAI